MIFACQMISNILKHLAYYLTPGPCTGKGGTTDLPGRHQVVVQLSEHDFAY